jgi:hypothetical protein
MMRHAQTCLAPQLVVEARWVGLTMGQHLRKELADMCIRAVIAEHFLEVEKQTKRKL